MLAAQLDSLIAQGVPAAEAAELLGVDVSVAKLHAGDLNFSDDDLSAALAGVASIAKHGEQERNRLQAGMFIIEVKKGYKAPKVDNRTQNITLVQQLINQANDDINEFARELRAGDRRGDPAAIEEQGPAEGGAGPATSGIGSSVDVPCVDGAAGEHHARARPACPLADPRNGRAEQPHGCEALQTGAPGPAGEPRAGAISAAGEPLGEPAGDRRGPPAPRYERPAAACIKGPTRV